MAITDVSDNAENEVTMKIQAYVGITINLSLALECVSLPVVGFSIGKRCTFKRPRRLEVAASDAPSSVPFRRAFFVKDHISGISYLIDSGASCSVISPAFASCKFARVSKIDLINASGSTIPNYDTQQMTLHFKGLGNFATPRYFGELLSYAACRGFYVVTHSLFDDGQACSPFAELP
ncbi:unnamed protein product [Clavelina lepadiformis]|uniref:Peptidase A2 domain-containing protein n=1 Tax=Clavelina lepadiformis TaxID=159417 RepID=A0ABP0G735_CLALP